MRRDVKTLLSIDLQIKTWSSGSAYVLGQAADARPFIVLGDPVHNPVHGFCDVQVRNLGHSSTLYMQSL